MSPLTPCMLAQDGSFEEIRFCSGNGLRLYDVLFLWVLVADMVHRNSNATLEGANSDREREGERARERESPIHLSPITGNQLQLYTPTKPHNKWGGHVPGGSEHPSCPDEEDEREREREGEGEGEGEGEERED